MFAKPATTPSTNQTIILGIPPENLTPCFKIVARPSSTPKAFFPRCFRCFRCSQSCPSCKSGTRGFQFFFWATNCSKVEIGNCFLWWTMANVHHIFTKVFATNDRNCKTTWWSSTLDKSSWSLLSGQNIQKKSLERNKHCCQLYCLAFKFLWEGVSIETRKAGGGGGRRRGRKHLTLIFITNITILTTIGKFLWASMFY